MTDNPSNASASRGGIRLNSVTRGPAVEFSVDGQRLIGYQGETIACAMSANGLPRIRRSRVGESPRGMFCAMGVCQECLIYDEIGAYVRGCVTLVEDGMRLSRIESVEAHSQAEYGK